MAFKKTTISILSAALIWGQCGFIHPLNIQASEVEPKVSSDVDIAVEPQAPETQVPTGEELVETPTVPAPEVQAPEVETPTVPEASEQAVTDKAATTVATANKHGVQTLRIYYHRDDNDYTGWDLWIWPDGKGGAAFEFTGIDPEKGAYVDLDVSDPNWDVSKIGFIVKQNGWDNREDFGDRFIKLGVDSHLTDNAEYQQDIFIQTGDAKVYHDFAQISNEKVQAETVRVHYYRFDQKYDGWNLWFWGAGLDASEPGIYFDGEDEYGKYVDIDVSMMSEASANLIVRKNAWEEKDTEGDRSFDLLTTNPDKVKDIYLIQGDATIYEHINDVDQSMSADYASFSALDKIEVKVPVNLGTDVTTKVFKDGVEVATTAVKYIDAVGFEITLAQAVEDLGAHYTIEMTSGDLEINGDVRYFKLFDTLEFNNKFVPKNTRGEDIYSDYGVNVGSESISFRVWTPTATSVNVKVYSAGQGDNYVGTFALAKAPFGTWVGKIPTEYAGMYYTYEVTSSGETSETMDPYAISAGVNGNRGLIANLEDISLEGFETDSFVALEDQVDAIIYEAHIRDLTISPTTNTSAENRGKYAGVTESGTTNEAGLTTGFDHIQEMGVSHVHFLPMFDHQSIDESNLDEAQFNWGYDPKNYNLPEGSYASNPADGTVRVQEMQQMIQTFHDNDLGVVLDVVYNHTGATSDSHLNKLVPDYYYRQNPLGGFSNGSGCGNEIASERAMVREMMVDSVALWAQAYHIDGFRFDLMGLHDIETMNEIAQTVRAINPDALLYGEGWDAGGSALNSDEAALKKNAQQLDGIAVFNDDMRDGIKGHVFNDTEPGFVNGLSGLVESVKFGIVGATQHDQVDYEAVNYSDAPYASTPGQSVNYVSAHDNFTLYDKFKETNPQASEAELKTMQKMANAIVLTSQGVPFLHAGVEMMRTKDGNHNSYNAPDSVNQIDWDLKTQNLDVVEYYQGMIAMRNAHPAFRLQTEASVQAALEFLEPVASPFDLNNEPGAIAYTLDGTIAEDTWDNIFVAFNPSSQPVTYEIPAHDWQVVADGETVNLDGITTLSLRTTANGTQQVVVPAMSTLIMQATATQPELDFGPEGDVTPEVTPEIDAGASEGFGPDGDVTPTVTPTIPTTGTPESNSTTTLPETGEQLQASLLVFGAMLLVAGSILAYRKKQTHN